MKLIIYPVSGYKLSTKSDLLLAFVLLTVNMISDSSLMLNFWLKNL
uniref:Uncharacterized protein n=1 Tax=Arundo donax TaxID=35708 RepID=A0A0A9EG86_ARUDO